MQNALKEEAERRKEAEEKRKKQKCSCSRCSDCCIECCEECCSECKRICKRCYNCICNCCCDCDACSENCSRDCCDRCTKTRNSGSSDSFCERLKECGIAILWLLKCIWNTFWTVFWVLTFGLLCFICKLCTAEGACFDKDSSACDDNRMCGEQIRAKECCGCCLFLRIGTCPCNKELDFIWCFIPFYCFS